MTLLVCYRRNSWELWENYSHVALDVGNVSQVSVFFGEVVYVILHEVEKCKHALGRLKLGLLDSDMEPRLCIRVARTQYIFLLYLTMKVESKNQTPNSYQPALVISETLWQIFIDKVRMYTVHYLRSS